MSRQCLKVFSQFPRNFNRLARPNPFDELWKIQRQLMSVPLMFPKIMCPSLDDLDRKLVDAFQDKEKKENIIYDKVDGLKIKMDVSQFKTKELTVKAAGEWIVIEGKHEEVQDELGSIQRHFVRKYQLPEGLDLKLLRTTITSDGVLCVSAPPVGKAAIENERVIPIEETGTPENKPNEPEKEKK